VPANRPLTSDRSNTSEYPKRSSTRSKNSSKINSPQIVAGVAQEEIREAGVIEDEARAEDQEDVVEGEDDNAVGRLLSSCMRLPRPTRRSEWKLWNISG
jgi:hypothetical protein